MQTESNSRWRLRSDVVSTVMTEGAVILDLRTKFFFSLNLSGWAIAQMFETSATRADVLSVSHNWGADDAHHSQINAFIDRLISEQLMEPASQSCGAGQSDVAVASWLPPLLSKHQEPLQRIMVSAFDPGLPLAE